LAVWGPSNSFFRYHSGIYRQGRRDSLKLIA
jgi:hypothetical protein